MSYFVAAMTVVAPSSNAACLFVSLTTTLVELGRVGYGYKPSAR